MKNIHRFQRLALAELFVLVASMFVLVGHARPQDAPFVGRSDVPQSSGSSWVATGTLNTARVDHTATLLQDGRVLVVGGIEKAVSNGHGGLSQVILGSAELYDPVTRIWSVTGHLSQPRAGHTATLLSDGRVLVVGGGDSTSEIYNPATGAWAPAGAMTAARSSHTATLLQDGRVLVAGGIGPMAASGASSTELFDPSTGVWSRTGDLNVQRFAHTATLLQDGRVLVAGGSQDIELASALASTELYDPLTGSWTSTGNLAAGRNSHTATLMPNGTVLVASGFDTTSSELYDPATGRWRTSGTLSVTHFGHAASRLFDGTVLVVGGGGVHAERYDSNTGTWQLLSDTIASRFGHTATLLRDGRVLVVGGSMSSGVPPSGFAALATADLFMAVAPMSVGPTLTGSWYDPAQSGHGLILEVLPDNRFYASWFTFNPAGTQQAWFSGVGTYSGNTATITDVEQPTGGRWIPNFDPSQVVRNAWGTLTFTFSDCDHGRVDFNSIAGYGSGSMNLTRLTQPAGLSCP